MSAVRSAHVKKIDGELKKALGTGDAALAERVIDALFKAHACSASVTGEYKSQFRAICLNFAAVAPLLKTGGITPEELAVMSSKDMNSPTAKQATEQIRKEEIAADILEEQFSAVCGKCGLIRMSIANTNVLLDLEDSDRCKGDDDFCYCDAELNDEDERRIKEEARKAREAEVEAAKRKEEAEEAAKADGPPNKRARK
eukprot:TRINITY_DN6785_c0_g1_i1.p2 TRINITY_DN6785_c0_g1~~TRINITY_DN6785_c0_g1_i1.p2  ORF type:complete len:210 (+),score=69.28 TRINITY_DN6785_c0_g1_i1:34-630(+)